MSTIDARLMDVLACPRCETPLDAAEALQCTACQVRFPAPGGVPLLFAEPEFAAAEWRERHGFAIRTLEGRAADAARALESGALSETTRARLELQRDAYRAQAEALTGLLAPYAVAAHTADRATSLALRTRLPADQGLDTYLPNVFRDFSWGEAENEASLEAVSPAIGTVRGGRMLVLGSGAGRLAIDIHERHRPALTLGLDFNPLLTLIASRVAAGETIALYEFPLAPRTPGDTAIRRELSLPPADRGGLHFVTADALRPPAGSEKFDVVVTPWLIDIVTDDFATFARRVNRLIAPGGRWVNFGSLTFRSPDPRLCHSLPEVIELVEEAGFARPDIAETEIDYLRSPASRHARRETVVTFAATKATTVDAPPKYRALPDWIVTGKQPVPLSKSFETQAATTRIHAFIMTLIDGRRSLKDMAELMEKQGLMPRDEALDSIRGFLIRMHDDSRRYSGF